MKKPENNRVLSIYFRDIEHIPMLTRQEERAVAERARKGDTRARQRLVEANIRFVVSAAKAFKKKYSHHNLSLEDLISFGHEGAMEAALKFNERRGVKFISYAVYCIRQRIKLGIAENDRTVRLPISRRESIAEVSAVSERLAHELGREPTIEEIVEMLPQNSKGYIRETPPGCSNESFA